MAGFGDQVPLSFAVRQIVPARFQVAFGEAVNSNAPVDWKGGKPWRPTLSDAVRPLGLTVSVVGATVTDPTGQISALTWANFLFQGPISFAPRPAMLPS